MRRIGGGRLDEDWAMVVLGVLLLVATLGLASVAAWTAHEHDAALQGASAAAQRLDVGGLDNQIYQNLVALQQDEIALFGLREDPSQAPAGHDPAADLTRVESDLIMLKARFSGSPQVQHDISLITWELPNFTSLEASALDYNERGLPLGAAYLRESSGYLTDYTLPTADNIRQVDQAQVSAADAGAAKVPWLLLGAAVIALACLVAVQRQVARYTRYQFDLWLLLSSAVTVAVVAWSVTAISASLRTVRSEASPHAVTAANLAQARVDGLQVNGDDLLTRTDHGEDCSATTAFTAGTYDYSVRCTFETDVQNYLNPPGGRLRADLASAALSAPDALARSRIATAVAAAQEWLTNEKGLPTLQNLASIAAQGKYGRVPRYNPTFVDQLGSYTSIDPGNAFEGVESDSGTYQDALTSAITQEWSSYDQQVANAAGPLHGVVTGLELLGLLAAALGGIGIAFRVREYWSAGGQP
jgi:hypothetical protein